MNQAVLPQQEQMDEFFETHDYDVPAKDWKEHPELGDEVDEEEAEV